jgi:FkbM family methyltransferase
MQPIKFRGFKLHYQNADVARSMVRQIDQFPEIQFRSCDRPLIIDAGTNIGVSMLEWKTRWPGARVVCFEPDPFAFAILKKNVEANDIPSVICHNVALAAAATEATLFGDIAPRGDARGNSIDPAWGNRDDSDQVKVQTRKLSTVIGNSDIQFLKLDIEGAEQQVIEEIQPQLGQIEAIYVEVHETHASLGYNSHSVIEKILTGAGFQIYSEDRFEQHALPAIMENWQQRVGARQTHLIGRR